MSDKYDESIAFIDTAIKEVRDWDKVNLSQLKNEVLKMFDDAFKYNESIEHINPDLVKFAEHVTITTDCNGVIEFLYDGVCYRLEESCNVNEIEVKGEGIWHKVRSDMILLWWSPTESEQEHFDVTPVGEVLEWMCGATGLEAWMDRYARNVRDNEAFWGIIQYIYDFEHVLKPHAFKINSRLNEDKVHMLLTKQALKLASMLSAIEYGDWEKLAAECESSIVANIKDPV